MIETINSGWRPHKKSSNALIAGGYSQEQLNSIGKTFIERFFGQEMGDASSKFSNMVRSSGSGHNVKAKNDGSSEVLSKRQADLSTQSKDGAERAVKVKQANKSGQSLQEKIENAAMVSERYGTPMDEAQRCMSMTDDEIEEFRRN